MKHIKRFNEFVNESKNNPSYSKDELDKYLSGFGHEPDGMYTDDDGSFELGTDASYSPEDFKDSFLDNYEKHNVEFVGMFSYFNNITGEPENENEYVEIIYDRETHEFDHDYVSFDSFKKDLKEKPTVWLFLRDLNEHRHVEIKRRNEEGIFSHNEAEELMVDGWELLSEEEWEYMMENFDLKWDDEHKGVYFGYEKIFLPSIDGEYGEYWTNEQTGPDTFKTFYFDNKNNIEIRDKNKNEKCQVRLVKFHK